MSRPRLLIEDWLPAQAVGVECMRERGSASALAPHTFLHVWWARRPLTASRAAVLASLLPADFDRAAFGRVLGFYSDPDTIIRNDDAVNEARAVGRRIENPHGKRAFTAPIPISDLREAHRSMEALWGELPSVIDPMAGGGSIPLEAARIGVRSLANEYNPVACSVLEATVEYPFRYGAHLAEKAKTWGKLWRDRFNKRMEQFFDVEGIRPAYTYIFARTVPCPDTEGHPPTPLVPDWSLHKPKGGLHVVAEPVVLDAEAGKWTIRVREVGKGAGQLRQAPPPTYKGGSAVSLYSKQPIPEDYIKAVAKQGNLRSVLYAVAVKTTKLEFRPVERRDELALRGAEEELERLRPQWEANGILPTESLSPFSNYDRGHRMYGMHCWADLFSPRQLLTMGVLVEELQRLRSEVVKAEGEDVGEAVIHLLAFALDKYANWNAMMASWNAPFGSLRSVFDKHNFQFKATFAEMAPCVSGGGLDWAIDNVLEAYKRIAQLPSAPKTEPVPITQGSASTLFQLDDKSVALVAVDPPYADNVMYSELADFFYVWLKRTQGHRRPEWFSSQLCEQGDEAIVNLAHFRTGDKRDLKQARVQAHRFYQDKMTEVFREAKRVLRDDGALTVMFTHKQQDAWAALFESLIEAGFTITATWPVQTEGQHSLHQAKKNAAQSTVILVARKRETGAGRGFYDDAMRLEISQAAQNTAARLRSEGLNAVDQLVGAFGPAMEVFSRYDEVKTDTGEKVGVAEAIQQAADAVARWRVEQLADRGLEGVDGESRFVLLCWDVLGAAEFRFNEAMLLGRAVGMDVARLKETGLVSATGEKVKLLPASERRREKPIRSEQEQLDLLGEGTRRRTRPSRKVHPNDEYFVSAIDMCHALALKHADSGGGQAGIGAARGMALQQGWGADSACAKLMTALVNAAPLGVRFPGKGRAKTAADEFPEFRAWHAMLKPLFGITPPEWTEPKVLQATLITTDVEDEDEEDEEEAEE